jgi:hypothetical protein
MMEDRFLKRLAFHDDVAPGLTQITIMAEVVISYGQKIETAKITGVPCSRATLPRVVSNDVSSMILPHQNGMSGRESRRPIF